MIKDLIVLSDTQIVDVNVSKNNLRLPESWSDATKKDFIDLEFFLDIFSLDDKLNFYEKKYSESSRFMAMKSITYFDDAEAEPMPNMLKEKSWSDIKKKILKDI